MPDGSVLTSCIDVDRYYGLNKGGTSNRIRLGWSIEECANNRRDGGKGLNKYEFHMPDGSIIMSCTGVDRYYNLGTNVTHERLKRGWTEEECAKNQKGVGKELKKYEFHMPDGSVLTRVVDVDRYYKLCRNATQSRIRLGWTEEECANNKREGGRERETYEFHMPDGSTITTCNEVDRYYNLGKNTTRQRLKRGWTEEECARNRRGG